MIAKMDALGSWSVEWYIQVKIKKRRIKIYDQQKDS